MDGLGACDLFEKCCDAASCRNRSNRHQHCPAGCTGARHFSNPQHDLPATAHTRAVNRACADLFGMGEVSAEEINTARGGGGYADDGGYGDQGGSGDTRDWWQEAGWQDEATGRKANYELLERLKAQPDEEREAIKARMKEAGIEVAKVWTKAQHDTIEGWLAPEPEEQPDEGADKAATEAEHQETLEAMAQEGQIPPADVEELAAFVKNLNAHGVDKELTRLRQHTEGKVDERRRRLTIALLQERLDTPVAAQ